MSTRATYKILDVCFYIKRDNYPLEAAFNFQRMLDYRELKEEDLDEAFSRANKDAEFTKDHSSHIDTEYQYDLIKKGNEYILKGYEIIERNMEHWGFFWYKNGAKYLSDVSYPPTKRNKFFEGSIKDFIKKYTPKKIRLIGIKQGEEK